MNDSPVLPTQTVTLTTYSWHLLLADMEEHMRIINRDQETTYQLYEAIAGQLQGAKVTITRPEPRKRMLDTTQSKGKSWWQRITDYWIDNGRP